MKYRKLLIIAVVGLMMFSATIRTEANALGKERIKDLLGFDEELKIVINEVYYRKEKIAKVEEGQELIISIDELKNILLNHAVVVSGEEINYMFTYETVIVFGDITIDKETTYYFKYNLAGFGTIFLTDTEYIQYGDIRKLLYQ